MLRAIHTAIAGLLVTLCLLWPAVAEVISGGGGTGGGGGGGGGITSLATGCGATGGTITPPSGTITASELLNPQTGTNYAIQNADCGKYVQLSNASNQVPTIAQAGSGGNFTAGWFSDVCNVGAGTQTLTPATSTINGAATYVLNSGNTTQQCIRIVSDGANYQAIPYGPGVVTGDCASATTNILSLNCLEAPFTGFQANFWYVPYGVWAQQSGISVAASTIQCHFGGIPARGTVQGLGIRVTTLGLTNGTAAIYSNVNGRPGALIGNVGVTAFATGTVGTKTAALAANKNLGPGGTDGGRNLWFCTNFDGTPSMSSTAAGNSSESGPLLGSATANNMLGANQINGVSCAGANCLPGGSSTCCTWPASLAGSSWTEVAATTVPVVIYEVVP